MLNRGLVKHVTFWVGMGLTFWGSFEQALDAGNNPLFGHGLGIPFLHHWVVGWLIAAVSYFAFTRQDWILAAKVVRARLVR